MFLNAHLITHSFESLAIGAFLTYDPIILTKWIFALLHVSFLDTTHFIMATNSLTYLLIVFIYLIMYASMNLLFLFPRIILNLAHSTPNPWVHPIHLRFLSPNRHHLHPHHHLHPYPKLHHHLHPILVPPTISKTQNKRFHFNRVLITPPPPIMTQHSSLLPINLLNGAKPWKTSTPHYKKNGTLSLVPLGPNTNIIDGQWVYRLMRDKDGAVIR